MSIVTNTLDLFCRINVLAEMPHREFVLLIAACAGGCVHANSVRSRTLDISVDENDTSDPAQCRAGSKRWLYFPYTLEVDPANTDNPGEYVACVSSLLNALWSRGFDAVAACEFEEQLPTNQRRLTWLD